MDIRVLDANPLYKDQIYRLRFRFSTNYPIGKHPSNLLSSFVVHLTMFSSNVSPSFPIRKQSHPAAAEWRGLETPVESTRATRNSANFSRLLRAKELHLIGRRAGADELVRVGECESNQRGPVGGVREVGSG